MSRGGRVHLTGRRAPAAAAADGSGGTLRIVASDKTVLAACGKCEHGEHPPGVSGTAFPGGRSPCSQPLAEASGCEHCEHFLSHFRRCAHARLHRTRDREAGGGGEVGVGPSSVIDQVGPVTGDGSALHRAGATRTVSCAQLGVRPRWGGAAARQCARAPDAATLRMTLVRNHLVAGGGPGAGRAAVVAARGAGGGATHGGGGPRGRRRTGRASPSARRVPNLLRLAVPSLVHGAAAARTGRRDGRGEAAAARRPRRDGGGETAAARRPRQDVGGETAAARRRRRDGGGGGMGGERPSLADAAAMPPHMLLSFFPLATHRV